MCDVTLKKIDKSNLLVDLFQSEQIKKGARNQCVIIYRQSKAGSRNVCFRPIPREFTAGPRGEMVLSNDTYTRTRGPAVA